MPLSTEATILLIVFDYLIGRTLPPVAQTLLSFQQSLHFFLTHHCSTMLIGTTWQLQTSNIKTKHF